MRSRIKKVKSTNTDDLLDEINILTDFGWKLVSVYCVGHPNFEPSTLHVAWLSKEIKIEQPEKEMD